MENQSADLVARWRDGEQEAAAELVQRYTERLLALARSRLSAKLARHIDPEDVVQSAYRSFFAGARDDRFVLERSGDLWRLLAAITLHKLHHRVERHTTGKRALDREFPFGGESTLWGLQGVQLAREPSPADAAALAGAAEGEAAAREVAERNRAELVGFDRVGDSVVVEVEIDGITAFARARARRVPVAGGPGTSTGTGERAGLAPAMLAALAVAESRLSRPVPIVSGFRSRAQQEALWERRAGNPYPVAPPGSSLHERGLAVDVPRDFVDDLLAVAGEAGLCQPLPESDPVHFVVCGA